MFTHLKRVVYQVPDLGAAKRWYSAILKTVPVFDSPQVAIFNIDGASLSLMPGIAPLADDTGRLSVYWEVEDVDAAYQRLIDAGARPHTEIRDVFMIRIARVYDPFGNILGLTGPIPGQREQTVENQPSQTAVGVAICRALAACDERPELKGPDYLAELFLTDEVRAPLKNPAARAKVISEFISARRYGYMMARTAFIERLFEAALRDGIPQIVFLGAGYDTRTHRHAQSLNDTIVYELDAPTTQNRKRRILEEAGVETPAQLRYVPVNFKTDDLRETLRKAGFNADSKTFYVWEGVTYYLAPEAIDATFRFVRDNSPAGSSICFDYMTSKMESFYVGEPFLFWRKKEEMESLVANHGFQIRDHLDAGEMERRFLTLADGTVAEGVMPHFGFVYATVAR
jgi:methyltransferase (TIGR00027 family)